ncbi:MAG: hypothetical protein QM564_13850 [Bergeyella sp.]
MMKAKNNSVIPVNKLISQKTAAYSAVAAYVFINGIFTFKYAPDFRFAAFLMYVLFISGGIFLYKKIKFQEKTYKWLFWIVSLLFFIFTVILNLKIDGYSLIVDRWSAMQSGADAILHNRFPYLEKSHQGQPSSNLPGLVILGIPFYLIFGNVQYLQNFCFLLFVFLVYRSLGNHRQRLLALILLIVSPSYLWELYTKSDVFSNFVFALGYALLVWKYFLKKRKIPIVWIAVLTALIMLTRLSVVLLLAVLLLKPFWNFTAKDKIKFLSAFGFTILFILFLFLRNAENTEMIMSHNPLLIQGGKQPVLLSIFCLFLASLVSFKLNTFTEIISGIAGILFLTVFFTLIQKIMEFGLKASIDESYMDLSFFSMAMPFLLIAISMLNINPQKE